jgi:hypothetical protein
VTMSAASLPIALAHRSSSEATAFCAQMKLLSMFASSSALRRRGANAKAGQFGEPNGTFPYNEGS